MVLSTLFWVFEVQPSIYNHFGDLCGRNGLKSKVSTLEELYDFSLKTLKNYITRCDFWSYRHFVDRLINLVVSLNYITLWGDCNGEII